MSDSEKWQELVDNILDKVAKLAEQWDHRLTVNNLRLSERYLVGEVAFLI